MTTNSYTDEQMLSFVHAYEGESVATVLQYLFAERQRLQASVDAKQALIEALRPDRHRLNWLAMQYVEVRTPARYGSIACFLESPEHDEVLGDQPWDIRAVIDKARATPNETKEAKS